jgi:hypothetical protein
VHGWTCCCLLFSTALLPTHCLQSVMAGRSPFRSRCEWLARSRAGHGQCLPQGQARPGPHSRPGKVCILSIFSEVLAALWLAAAHRQRCDRKAGACMFLTMTPHRRCPPACLGRRGAMVRGRGSGSRGSVAWRAAAAMQLACALWELTSAVMMLGAVFLLGAVWSSRLVGGRAVKQLWGRDVSRGVACPRILAWQSCLSGLHRQPCCSMGGETEHMSSSLLPALRHGREDRGHVLSSALPARPAAWRSHAPAGRASPPLCAPPNQAFLVLGSLFLEC